MNFQLKISVASLPSHLFSVEVLDLTEGSDCKYNSAFYVCALTSGKFYKNEMFTVFLISLSSTFFMSRRFLVSFAGLFFDLYVTHLLIHSCMHRFMHYSYSKYAFTDCLLLCQKLHQSQEDVIMKTISSDGYCTCDDCFREGVCKVQKWPWLCMEQDEVDPLQRSDHLHHPFALKEQEKKNHII